MNAVAYMPLLYGKDYLWWSIKSIIDAVDQFYILYTSQGSYGHKTDIPCPDDRATLHRLATFAAGKKLIWVDGVWNGEGDHRDTIYSLAPLSDVILAVDYDEIWPEGLAKKVIELVNISPERHFRLPMIHFYRSFHYAIMHDPAFPVRAIAPRNPTSETTLSARPICHFGYAITPAMMRWKWLVHGHKNELRTDCDYFTDIYEANRQTDCHPVGNKAWNAERVNPLDFMPDYMANHAYFNKEVIE